MKKQIVKIRLDTCLNEILSYCVVLLLVALVFAVLPTEFFVYSFPPWILGKFFIVGLMVGGCSIYLGFYLFAKIKQIQGVFS